MGTPSLSTLLPGVWYLSPRNKTCFSFQKMVCTLNWGDSQYSIKRGSRGVAALLFEKQDFELLILIVGIRSSNALKLARLR